MLKNNKIPVILDTDIGLDIDDTWALGLLLKCPELDVKLISTVSRNTHIKTRLVAKFLEIANRTDIPLGIGPQISRRKGLLYDWVKDYNLSEYPGTIYENGIEAICDTIMESDKTITIIAIGPLGNIAQALIFNPKITQNARFVGMQGSINVGYAGKPSPAIEYNVFSDIQSCQEVFQATWEKTITPLDTCGNIVLSGENFEQIMNCDNPVVASIKENLEIWIKKRTIFQTELLKTQKETSILFDTVAIYMAFSEELLNIENLKIEVTKIGQTKVSENGNLIRCATSWNDVQAFKDLIVQRLISD
jgi:inosine-uridine nucleoside N-ribohydrolase